MYKMKQEKPSGRKKKQTKKKPKLKEKHLRGFLLTKGACKHTSKGITGIPVTFPNPGITFGKQRDGEWFRRS